MRAVNQAAVAAPEPVAAELEFIPLRCELNDTGPLPWLDLGADDADNLPSRVRVFERDGTVICVSDPAIYYGATLQRLAEAAAAAGSGERGPPRCA